MAFASSIDERICEFVSRGNKEAFNIIAEYHMNEVRKIRNYMLEILRDKYFYDISKLTQAFNEAVICLNIDVNDLLSPNYTIVSADTQSLTGTTASKVTPAVKTYTGFTSPAAKEVTIAADGSTVVKYYYKRNSYTITFNTNGGSLVSSLEVEENGKIVKIVKY